MISSVCCCCPWQFRRRVEISAVLVPTHSFPSSQKTGSQVLLSPYLRMEEALGSVRKASQESLSHSLCSTSVRKASQESLACSLHLLLCHTPGLSRERGGSPQGLCLLGFHQPFRPEELWIIPESQPGISKSEGAMSTRIALAVAHHPFLCVQRRVSTPFPSCPARHRGETEAGEAGWGV